MNRCEMVQAEQMIAYHDAEWGVPVHDDRTLFEFLILEGVEAGLSWSTILKKREAYRMAFAGFDPAKLAASMTPKSPAAGECRHRAQPPEDRSGDPQCAQACWRSRRNSGRWTHFSGGTWMVGLSKTRGNRWPNCRPVPPNPTRWART